jgi:two-component system nitrogen regulation sensor histidine kinase NtrY
MKKIRPIYLFILIFVIISLSLIVELHFLTHKSLPLITKLFLLLPLNISIIALLTLMFYVVKNIVKLMIERRYKIPGYKIKTKLVIIMVMITLIPTSFLFIITSGLITNYIDRWFSPRIKQPLDSSIEISKTFYEIERQRTLAYAKTLLKNDKVLKGYSIKRISKLPVDASETIKAAFNGIEGTEIISEKKGDIIRAVVPEYNKEKVSRVLVVETTLPPSISKGIDEIQDAYENYLMLEAWKIPIRINYILILGFMTLLVVFTALWIALRVSKGITEPIQKLVQSTEDVALGDLDVQLDIKRDDEIGQLVTSFNDMVKRLKKSQESLKSTYLYIKNILENINSGVIFLNTNGTISVINNAACKILGKNSEDLINKHYSELLSFIDSDELKKLVSSIEGRVFNPIKKQIEVTIADKKATLLVFVTGLKDEQKNIGMLVVFEDITDVLKAERIGMWQEIAMRVAHEIKNPLTPIKLSTERLIKKWQNNDPDFALLFPKSTQIIIKEVDSLKHLVDEFSLYGKMPEIKKTPTNLKDLIEDTIDLFKGYKDVVFNTSLPDTLPFVEIDPEQFRRVITNIIDNAIHVLGNNGRIDISVYYQEDLNKAYIDIADNGPGIKDELKDKLFKPYFSTKKNGTGLGLAIAYRIIEEHRGNIKIKDNKPTGTIFTIEFPIKEN